MKVLVLENISQLERECSIYLNKEHSNDDVKIIYNIDRSFNSVLKSLGECDILVLQTTFANRDQLTTILDLLPSYPNLKEIRIIYSLNNPADNNQFLTFLNLKLHRNDFIKIVNLLKTITIKEILCKTVITKAQEYFNQTDVIYDIVPLYYNVKKDMIWHTRMPIIDRVGFPLYLKDPVVKQPVSEYEKIEIHKNDYSTFISLMRETRALVELQLESCQNTDFGDSAILIKEKKQWLNLMDKYKL